MSGRWHFEKGERVQVRMKCGIVRDGYVKRAFSSGNYTLILDKPLSTGRQTHCQPDEVFAPAQEDLFRWSSANSSGGDSRGGNS